MKKLSPTTIYLLKSLIPYSKANLQLAYKPSRFFYELEKRSQTNERTLRSAFYRSVQKGLIIIDDDGVPRLTNKGLRKIKAYKPIVLGKNSFLLVTFDIPEAERHKRDHLRSLLYELKFEKIQQSVWASKYDHREILSADIKELGMDKYVQIFEAAQLKI
ncbi:MAG: hypothetical protein M3Q36_01550 [bacterium]|nr:hypothetical protein [bacterium]